MKCPNCGNENPDGTKFCTTCGTPLTAPGTQTDAAQAAGADQTAAQAGPQGTAQAGPQNAGPAYGSPQAGPGPQPGYGPGPQPGYGPQGYGQPNAFQQNWNGMTNDLKSSFSGGGLYSNVGGKLCALAQVICWIGIVVSIIVGIAVMVTVADYSGGAAVVTGLLTIVLGALGSWIGSMALYGFGNIVQNVAAMRADMESRK